LPQSRQSEIPGIEIAHEAHHILANTGHPTSMTLKGEPSMATVKVDTSNFQSEVLDSAEPVVVDFWAEWCGPCKMIAPSLEEISTELAGKVKVVKLNIDENPELAAQFGVRSIPTLAMFKGGEVADIKVGAAPKTALSAWISSAA
jgi:thioredoxin 1